MHNRSYLDGHEDHPHFISNQNVTKLKKFFGSVKRKKDAIAIIKALSDPSKLSIFLLLTKVEELTVSDIAEVVCLSQSAVSHALADLKKLGLADCRSCGQLRCYFLIKEQAKDRKLVLQLFERVFISEHTGI